MTFHANCLLRRQFAWNIKSCFLGKIRKYHQFVVCWKSQRVVKVNLLDQNSSRWHFKMSCAMRKCTFEHVQNAQIQIHSMHAQSHLGICSPLIYSIVFNDSVSWQRRSWSDCADTQADLGLRCPHMPEDTFSIGVAQTFYLNRAWRIVQTGDNLHMSNPTS